MFTLNVQMLKWCVLFQVVQWGTALFYCFTTLDVPKTLFELS